MHCDFSSLSPSRGQSRGAGFREVNRISGTAQDGIYEADVLFPEFSEAGTWNVVFFDAGQRGEQRRSRPSDLATLGFPTTLEVLADPTDTTAPILGDLSFSPETIDVSREDQNVTVRVRILDDLAGHNNGSITFLSPSRGQARGAGFRAVNRIAGDANDGIYEAQLGFPQFSETGPWNAVFVSMQDNVGNNVGLDQSHLEALGFPTTLQVTLNPPPEALCQDVTVDADSSCRADISVDAGTFDPDDDAITLVQDPPGPYHEGSTTVELVVTGDRGASSRCEAVVTVEDNTAPTLTCPPPFLSEPRRG